MLTGDAALGFALRGLRRDGPRRLALVLRGLLGARSGGCHGANLVSPPGSESRKSPGGDAVRSQSKLRYQEHGRGKAGRAGGHDVTSKGRTSSSAASTLKLYAETRLGASWGFRWGKHPVVFRASSRDCFAFEPRKGRQAGMTTKQLNIDVPDSEMDAVPKGFSSF